jgi:hypothetical protein
MVVENPNKIKSVLRAAKYVTGKDFNSLEELSDEQIVFFQSLSVYELSRAFIQSDLLEGKMSMEAIATKYGVSKGHVQDCEKRLVEFN